MTSSASSDPDSRILLLMRHGKAEKNSVPDLERPLAEKGRTQATMVGEYLESQKVRPTHVLVSDSVRTRETWEQVLEAMPGFDGKVTHHEDIYTGGPAEVAGVIRDHAGEHRVVMVIGHEPTMSALTHAIADDDSDPGSLAQTRIGLPTGALCVLSSSQQRWDEVGEDTMTLHTIVRS